MKTNKPSYLGHRKRIKEKYKSAGFNGWLDYEVLEFALSYAIPRKDTKPIKKALKTVEIRLLDHILVAQGGYYSFKEEGIGAF